MPVQFPTEILDRVPDVTTNRYSTMAIIITRVFFKAKLLHARSLTVLVVELLLLRDECYLVKKQEEEGANKMPVGFNDSIQQPSSEFHFFGFPQTSLTTTNTVSFVDLDIINHHNYCKAYYSSF